MYTHSNPTGTPNYLSAGVLVGLGTTRHNANRPNLTRSHFGQNNPPPHRKTKPPQALELS